MAVIEVNGLTKTFRTYRKQPGLAGALRGLFRRETETTLAVNDISFRIEAGELVGFVGPNGAGKTTTLKMLAGLLYPTSGAARVLGYVPWERKDGYRRQFALLLGQKNQLWWDLPARESLALNAKIYGIPEPVFTATVGELTELLAVSDKLSVMVRELSLGERMKMELIAALLHQPKVLFLDEPTIGLDVVSQKTVREFLRHHNRARQTTILLTSHYMADIQELCRRVIIIDHGRLFFDGPLAEVLDRFADFKLVTIHCADRPPPASGPLTPALSPSAGERVDLSKYGELMECTPTTIRLKVKRERVVTVCKAVLDELPVSDLDIQEVPVEDIIRRIFAGQAGAPLDR
jgi:ABC-2 type transport system ATP-binding protein